MAIIRRINTPFSDIPIFFRRNTYAEIFESVETAGNLQLIGLWGFGKSLTLRVLESNQDQIKNNLKVDMKTLVFVSDLSLLADGTTTLVLKHIFSKMLGLDRLESRDGVDLTHEIQKYFDSARAGGKKIIIVLDSLEKLTAYHNLEPFSFLYALYKQNMDILSFVFCFECEVAPEQAKAKFGDLGKLMFNKIMYLTPLDKKEEDWFIDSIAGMASDVVISPVTKKVILDASGGYMVSIKRLIEAVASGENVNEIIENPAKLSGLAYSLDILLDGLGGSVETLKKILTGESDLDPNQIDILQKHYLITKNNAFVSQVLANYLRSKLIIANTGYREKIRGLSINTKLSASEYKIIDILAKNKGEIISREDIINFVWGEKAEAGISDHALDQLIHRLKVKIAKDGYKIETLRGRGHRLV